MKKIFIFLLLLLLMSGCNTTNEGIKYKVFIEKGEKDCVFAFANKAYNENIPVSSVYKYVINTYDELVWLCDEYNCPAFDGNSFKYNHKMSILIRSFEQTYFENNSLIIMFGHTNVSYDSYLYSITINEDTICLNQKPHNGGSITVMDIRPWTVIYGVSKEDIVNANKIEIVDTLK